MNQKRNPSADDDRGFWLTLISVIESKRYSWFFLFLSMVFEILGINYMHLSNSYTEVTPSILYFIFFSMAVSLLPPIAFALRADIVYVIWSGIGSIATLLIGRLQFNKSIKPLQVSGMVLIIIGVLLMFRMEKNNKNKTRMNSHSAYWRLKGSPSPLWIQNSPGLTGTESGGWLAKYIYLAHTKPWAWLMLLIVIATEVAGTTCIRLSYSYTRLIPSVLFFVFYAISDFLLPPVAEGLGIGTVYVIWSGVGSFAAVIIGKFVFDEKIDVYKGIGMVTVILGSILMAWGDEDEKEEITTAFIINRASMMDKVAQNRGASNDDLGELLNERST